MNNSDRQECESVNAREGEDTEKNSAKNSAVDIFPSPGRILRLACSLVGMMLLCGFVVIIGEPLVQVIGVAGVAFSLLGLGVALRTLYLSRAKKPLLRVESDRILYRHALRKTCETLLYRDVQFFALRDVRGIKFIVAQRRTQGCKTLPINSSIFSDVQDLCCLLNTRLKEARRRKPLARVSPSVDTDAPSRLCSQGGKYFCRTSLRLSSKTLRQGQASAKDEHSRGRNAADAKKGDNNILLNC